MKYKVDSKPKNIPMSLRVIGICIFIGIAVAVCFDYVKRFPVSNTDTNNTSTQFAYANCNFEPRIASIPEWFDGMNATEYIRSIKSVTPSNEELSKAEMAHSACIATLPLYGGQVVWDVYLGYTMLDYRPVITIKNNNGMSFEIFDCNVKKIEANYYNIVIYSNTKTMEISCAGRFWEEYMVVF